LEHPSLDPPLPGQKKNPSYEMVTAKALNPKSDPGENSNFLPAFVSLWEKSA